MGRRRAGRFALGLLLVASGRRASGRDGGYQIIVHPESPVRELSRSFLRDAFLKRTNRWSHGPTIRPVDLVPRAPVREVFTRDVLGRAVAEVKRYWQQQIFSGKNVPPPELESEAEVLAYVLKHTGAIGYLPAAAQTTGARVVMVR
jgi:ABC-type phosphate transport system substrate-binding protein